jgi:hypothetical protein
LLINKAWKVTLVIDRAFFYRSFTALGKVEGPLRKGPRRDRKSDERRAAAEAL